MMLDTDYGKKSRRDYAEKHPSEDPAIDAAYVKGEPQPDPVGLTKAQVRALRSKYAERATRYRRPARGYRGADHHHGPVQAAPDPAKVKLDPKTEELIGGGVYGKNPPASDEERCRNAYRWVEDVFWPKHPQPGQKDGSHLHHNWAKLERIDSGELDVGKPLPQDEREGWYCTEQVMFLAYLLRELGYKVQYKNILPSLSAPGPDGKQLFDVQTAALNVWFEGRWHFFDPFESFSDDEGGLDAYTRRGGNIGCGQERDAPLTPYHDIYAYSWENPNYGGFMWAAPHGLIDPDFDEMMKTLRWTPRRFFAEAGILFRNGDERVRVGLAFDTAHCGYTGEGERRDTLDGAVYRPYGRLVGPTMGDPDAAPALDELITYNLYDAGLYDLVLVVTNTSYAATRYEISIAPSSSPYLKVTMRRRRVAAGRLPARASKHIPIHVKVTELAPRPPASVRDLQARVLAGGRVALEWSPVANAEGYRVFRRAGKEILGPQDLESAQLIAEPAVSGLEDRPEGGGLLFYAVLALGARGIASELDWEEGSSAIARLPDPGARGRT